LKDTEVNYEHYYTHELPMTDGATVSALAMMMVDYTQRMLGEDNKDWTLTTYQLLRHSRAAGRAAVFGAGWRCAAGRG